MVLESTGITSEVASMRQSIGINAPQHECHAPHGDGRGDIIQWINTCLTFRSVCTDTLKQCRLH
jgi:hypothetical protein